MSPVDARLRLSLIVSVVHPSLHSWKVYTLHCKILDTVKGEVLIDLWDVGCVRKLLELLVDESLRIAFVKDVLLVGLDDASVEEEDTRRKKPFMEIRTASVQSITMAACLELSGLLKGRPRDEGC